MMGKALAAYLYVRAPFSCCVNPFTSPPEAGRHSHKYFRVKIFSNHEQVKGIASFSAWNKKGPAAYSVAVPVLFASFSRSLRSSAHPRTVECQVTGLQSY
jgi:hypothetical protein